MNRSEMIDHILSDFTCWDNFYLSMRNGQKDQYKGWYVCYEGFLPNDMYLQSDDPRSDKTGEVITAKDCDLNVEDKFSYNDNTQYFGENI